MSPPHAAGAAYLEAMLAAVTGDVSGAALQLRTAAAWAERENIGDRDSDLVDQAFVEFALGDLQAAYNGASKAHELEPYGINTAGCLLLKARSALWIRDVDAARQTLAEMSGIDGKISAAGRLTNEAGIAALEQRRESATAGYATARDAWRTLDAPFPLALCELDQVLLMGAEAAGPAVVNEAEAILTELGAAPFLTRLERALNANPLTPAGPESRTPSAG